MTASEIKYRYQQLNPSGHFFDRETMKFFGDSMANFGVRSAGDGKWHLYRRRAVKHGLLGNGWIFDNATGRMSTLAAATGSHL